MSFLSFPPWFPNAQHLSPVSSHSIFYIVLKEPIFLFACLFVCENFLWLFSLLPKSLFHLISLNISTI